jgi:hypothetical protein
VAHELGASDAADAGVGREIRLGHAEKQRLHLDGAEADRVDSLQLGADAVFVDGATRPPPAGDRTRRSRGRAPVFEVQAVGCARRERRGEEEQHQRQERERGRC